MITLDERLSHTRMRLNLHIFTLLKEFQIHIIQKSKVERRKNATFPILFYEVLQEYGNKIDLIRNNLDEKKRKKMRRFAYYTTKFLQESGRHVPVMLKWHVHCRKINIADETLNFNNPKLWKTRKKNVLKNEEECNVSNIRILEDNSG